MPLLLGNFANTFKTPFICKKCNNEDGSALELAVGRSSFYAIIRASLGIRSAHGKRKKKPFRDPLSEARKKPSDPFGDVTVDWQGFGVSPARMKESGRFDLPNSLLCELPDGTALSLIEVEGWTVDQIVTKATEMLAEAKAEGKKLQVRVFHAQAVAEEVIRRVSQAGFRTQDARPEAPGPIMLTGRITGYLDEVHLRAHGFWLLKGLLYAGYDPRYLVHLADYVRTGVYNADLCASTWQKLGEIKVSEVVEQQRFSHRIEWQVNGIYAFGMVTVFADGQSALLARYRVKLGEASSILVPGPGAIIAGYLADGKAGEGWIELVQGSRVVRSSRPP